MLDLSLIK